MLRSKKEHLQDGLVKTTHELLNGLLTITLYSEQTSEGVNAEFLWGAFSVTGYTNTAHGGALHLDLTLCKTFSIGIFGSVWVTA